ncbi:MAG: efflux RND transporter permease subunit [Deltaproteobacteria bacterium]|nr:MAG: efflux RND transporter permease subunit [Deltaproteobacteria bacterium]
MARRHRGPIAWMATNSVAANLAMLVLLIGGLVTALTIRQEVFPDFKLDVVTIQVPYPGASPSDVEEGVIVALEEAIRGVDGVKKVTSTAAEDQATVYIELRAGTDPDKALSDVKSAVDAVTTLPKQAERPIVSLVVNRVEVISVILYGPDDPFVLREAAEIVRNRLLDHPLVEQVDLLGARPREVSVEVDRDTLRAYDLSLPDLAGLIGARAVQLSGGAVKTPGGEVLVRTNERRHRAAEYRDLPLVATPDGVDVRLGEIADVRDAFEENDEVATFDGRPAIMLRVLRSGEHGPIEVAAAVREVVRDVRPDLPPAIQMATWVDWSRIYRERINLLLRNGVMGLVLVLVVLGMFLEVRLAFWVTMGIPVSFLGAILLAPGLDVTINMISLFAFIVVLGMVVDDAIVVGENVYARRQQGMGLIEAAISGTREVAVPVTFSIATTVAAFSPMFFVPGFSGKLFRVIPTVVISVLAISLLESVFVLPAHLGHLARAPKTGWYAFVHARQQRVAAALEHFIEHRYGPFLRRALRWRYTTVATGIAVLAVFGGIVGGGHIPFRYMPNIDGDLVIANVEMPYGVSLDQARQVQRTLVEGARRAAKKMDAEDQVQGIFALIGRTFIDDPGKARRGPPSAHEQNVQVFLVPQEEREFVASEFARAFRDEVGDLPGVESIRFKSDIGPTPGRPIHVTLRHEDLEVLERAASRLGEALSKFAGVRDIDDGVTEGKPQFDLRLTPSGHTLGITAADLGAQVRGAFYGSEALRQQEGRDEVRVMVRLPRDQRASLSDLERLPIRTPSGAEVPLGDVAEVIRTRNRASIRREDGRRAIDVTADVVEGVAEPGKVLAALEADVLPDLLAEYPGLSYGFGGENKEQTEVLASLQRGGLIAMLVVYALLAIPFKSYTQPLIVMSAIPFGVVGAIVGHLVMGFELSIVSAMGLVALAGVVVNDSLVLIDAANRYRREGADAFAGIERAGIRRFRPILLTSLTTFFGLTPMILERSAQARFLVPMAISLGFGVLAATFIVLLLVPALYLILEDVRPGAVAPAPDEDGEDGQGAQPSDADTRQPLA